MTDASCGGERASLEEWVGWVLILFNLGIIFTIVFVNVCSFL